MKNRIASAIKTCAAVFGGMGCLTSILIAWNSPNESIDITGLFVGISSSIMGALLIAGFGELIEVIQRGFFELNQTQIETRNTLLMINEELQSESKDKSDTY